MGESCFKKCTMCSKIWETREEFLKDEELELNGYTADFEILSLGLFYFTHNRPECRSTLTLYAGDFWDLYTGELFTENLKGEDGCFGYCDEKEKLDKCEMRCEGSYVREIIQVIKSYK